MTFKERYTTAAIKTSVSLDKDATPEMISKENAKIEVSNDAYLSAEMTEKLIDKIEFLSGRLK